jgi:hypothetical protein
MGCFDYFLMEYSYWTELSENKRWSVIIEGDWFWAAGFRSKISLFVKSAGRCEQT